MSEIDNWTNEVHQGDAEEVLEQIPDESVNCVMTSPPYWNLRDYDHDGQIGLEEDSERYVENIANVMDKVHDVLRDGGSLWLNLGDTYDNKDLQQIPARVALELQERGWILRNRVTWAKPDAMPQSVKDRLNDTTEAVFHFVKNKDYWYDLDAIRVPNTTDPRGTAGDKLDELAKTGAAQHGQGGSTLSQRDSNGKNPGDVWNISKPKFPDAHFAVYPPELCEKPIKATCPEDGIVLDPFMGSGTTAIVAEELDRDWIGIDLNKDYVDMSYDRIDDETKRIFDERSVFDY